MDRSLRFRVYPHELSRPFGLAFASAPRLRRLASLVRRNSPDHNAKGTQSPHESPKQPIRLPPLVGTRFQVLFHSPPGVLFTFPSRYSCTIGRGRVFSLGGWSPQFQPELLGSSGLLGYRYHGPDSLRLQGSHLLWQNVPIRFDSRLWVPRATPHTSPTTPASRKKPVWALPLSLAATHGISVDFSSSRY